jgi:hypothetical protein
VDLDLVSLLLNKSDTARQRINWYKKTRELRLEKENFISFNNLPINIDEAYTFELNENTSYLNIFLWTRQYTNKMSKMKNVLVGYVSFQLKY